MIAVAGFFAAYLLPVPLMAFEIFVGFIQAVVFAMLTLFFIKIAIAEPHGKRRTSAVSPCGSGMELLQSKNSLWM